MNNEEIVLFDIDFLISPSVKEKVDKMELDEKIEMMFKLLDYRHSGFSADEVAEIEQSYVENMGNDDVNLEAYSLDKSDKELIREYAGLFPDYEDVKNVFNGLSNSLTKEETVNEATQKIDIEYDRRKKAAADRKLKIIENLTFDDDPKEKDKANKKSEDTNELIRRRSFDTILHQINTILGNE